jgi:tripartite-type tricarboxylate transporter receptor subunit TctC
MSSPNTIGLAALLVLSFTPAAAQNVASTFPSKPIRIVVTFTTGGATDTIARILGQKLAESLGQQVLIDNRPGAGGALGTDLVAKAPPDGYTLVLSSFGPMAIGPHVYAKLPYDPVKDLAPITLAATSWYFMVVHPTLPATTVKEFIALAKQKPGDLKYASSGVGTFLHLGGELFKLLAGVDILHVPFRGAGPALINVVGGHSQASFASVPSVIGHVRSGKLRAIGSGGTKRSFALPDVPTVAEQGVTGYNAANWIGIVAPAGTPSAVVARLHKEISAIQDTDDLKKRFAREGTDVMRMGIGEFGAFMASEHAKWGKVIKDAKIKPQ